LLYLAGPTLLLYFSINADSPNLIYVAGVIGLFGMITVGAVVLHERALETNQQIAAAEAQIKERPEESKPAWDLARIKLESYLDRNLIQITSIFFLTVLVMIMGFAIIVYGIAKVYANPQLIAPTVVVTVSGIIVEFIGASFLIIYKSTMEQARDYVTVLERINAVGMSVQILDLISDAEKDKLKNEARATLAKELISLYGSIKKPS
jgi:hypothetical protein